MIFTILYIISYTILLLIARHVSFDNMRYGRYVDNWIWYNHYETEWQVWQQGNSFALDPTLVAIPVIHNYRIQKKWWED